MEDLLFLMNPLFKGSCRYLALVGILARFDFFWRISAPPRLCEVSRFCPSGLKLPRSRWRSARIWSRAAAVTRRKLFSDGFPSKSTSGYGNNAVRAVVESQVTVMLNLNEARDLARDFYGVHRHNRLFAWYTMRILLLTRRKRRAGSEESGEDMGEKEGGIVEGEGEWQEEKERERKNERVRRMVGEEGERIEGRGGGWEIKIGMAIL